MHGVEHRLSLVFSVRNVGMRAHFSFVGVVLWFLLFLAAAAGAFCQTQVISSMASRLHADPALRLGQA